MLKDIEEIMNMVITAIDVEETKTVLPEVKKSYMNFQSIYLYE
jgi:hypothetical protein